MDLEPSGGENSSQQAVKPKKRSGFQLTGTNQYLDEYNVKLDIHGIRGDLGENICVKVLHAIQTSRYPVGILDDRLFMNMRPDQKDLLKNYWGTFDLFKPAISRDPEGTFVYLGDCNLIEVKSKSLFKYNEQEFVRPTFSFTMKQKEFFEAPNINGIHKTIFAVFFLPNWKVEISQYEYSEVEKVFTQTDVFFEERMKRIRGSPTARFHSNLMEYELLDRFDEKKLIDQAEVEEIKYLSEMVKNPNPYYGNIIDRHYRNLPKKRRVKNVAPVIDMSNANKPWSREEDDQLRQEKENKTPISDITKIHKRTEGDIINRLEFLNLI